MDPFTIGSAVAGIAGGLFGKRKNRNPFRDQINAQTRNLQNIGQTYAGMANGAQSRYNTYRPQADRALSTYTDYLKQDPYTDQVSTRVLGNATTGTNLAYDAAKANLAASMARRGLSGDSSAQLGGDTAIETARAGDFAGAQSQLAMAKLGKRESNLSQLTGLLGGVADNEYGNWQDATGRQAGITSNLLDTYTEQNRQANAESAADYNQQVGLWSNLGGLAGSALGPNPFRTTKTPNPNPPFYPTPDGGPITVDEVPAWDIDTSFPGYDWTNSTIDPMARMPTELDGTAHNPTDQIYGANTGGYVTRKRRGDTPNGKFASGQQYKTSGGSGYKVVR